MNNKNKDLSNCPLITYLHLTWIFKIKITIKESPIQCPKDDEDIKQFPTGKIFDKYDDTRLLNKYKKMKQRFNALSEEVNQIKAYNKPKVNQAIYNHLFSNR